MFCTRKSLCNSVNEENVSEEQFILQIGNTAITVFFYEHYDKLSLKKKNIVPYVDCLWGLQENRFFTIFTALIAFCFIIYACN